MGSASSTRGPQFLEICKAAAKLGLRISRQDYPYRMKPVEYSFIKYSDRFREIRDKLMYFMERYCYTNERLYLTEVKSGKDRWTYVPPIIEELKTKARAMGLWNLFLPSISGLTQLEYAHLCEITGRSLIGPECFNCSAPDTGNMETLHQYGT